MYCELAHPACIATRGHWSMQNYVLGHSKRELRRLMLQADNLRPITTRLLREIGLLQGIRASSTLVAERVTWPCSRRKLSERPGPSSGSIATLLRIATARERARAAGHANIEFVEGNASEMIGSGNCDLAIGRYVLVHQSDPVALIRAAVTHLRPGGAVAFHEVFLLGTWWSFPVVPLWEGTSDLINRTFRSVVAYPDAGARDGGTFLQCRSGVASPVFGTSGGRRPRFASLRMGCGNPPHVVAKSSGNWPCGARRDRYRQA